MSFILYPAGDCLSCPKESLQSCLCGKSQSKRPCAVPEWQCDQVSPPLAFTAFLACVFNKLYPASRLFLSDNISMYEDVHVSGICKILEIQTTLYMLKDLSDRNVLLVG